MSSNKDDKDKNKQNSGLSGLAIAGIVIGSIIVLAIIGAIIYHKYKMTEYMSMLKEDVPVSVYPKVFQSRGDPLSQSRSSLSRPQSISLSRTLSR